MSSEDLLVLVSDGFEATVPYHKLGFMCAKFRGIQSVLRLCPANRYDVRSCVPHGHLRNFVDYVECAGGSEASRMSIINKENYASLVALAEEFQCEQLKTDLSAFKSTWNERVDDMLRQLSRCDGDEGQRTLEEVLSDDVDILPERIQALSLGDLPPNALFNIWTKRRANGGGINSTGLCHFILSNPSSYAPLLEFVDFGELPAELGLRIIACDDTQDWIPPKPFFQFMSDLIGSVNTMNRELQSLKQKNRDLVTQVDRLSSGLSKRNSVLSWLRAREVHEDKTLVVVRKSSNDFYNVLDPEIDDEYASSYTPGAWVEIKFRSPIRINGFRVTSGSWNFPKTFDVIFSDGAPNGDERRVSFVDEAGLYGPGLSVQRSLDDFSVKLIKIESRGPNWREHDRLCLGGFELFSPDERYAGGVFHSIFANNRRHLSDIFDVRARDHDGSEVHKRPPGAVISTRGLGENEWIEFGLVDGRVVVTTFRVRYCGNFLQFWSLRGSNDRDAPLTEWSVIHSHRTDSADMDEERQFLCSSRTPFKFFRIVKEASREGPPALSMKYFDFDGVFVPD